MVDSPIVTGKTASRFLRRKGMIQLMLSKDRLASNCSLNGHEWKPGTNHQTLQYFSQSKRNRDSSFNRGTARSGQTEAVGPTKLGSRPQAVLTVLGGQ